MLTALALGVLGSIRPPTLSVVENRKAMCVELIDGHKKAQQDLSVVAKSYKYNSKVSPIAFFALVDWDGVQKH